MDQTNAAAPASGLQVLSMKNWLQDDCVKDLIGVVGCVKDRINADLIAVVGQI